MQYQFHPNTADPNLIHFGTYRFHISQTDSNDT